MNSENLRLFICLLYIQLYITRQARPYQNGSNRCDRTKKLRCYKQIRLTLSTKETNLYQNVDTKPSKPRNHQSNETTFNANRLITVT